MSHRRPWPWIAGIVIVAVAASFCRTVVNTGHNHNPPTTFDLLLDSRKLKSRDQPDPSAHLRMVGTATFVMGEQTTTQDAELLLAGPSRMRFELEQDGARNVFAFDGEDAWLLTPGAESWTQHDGGLLWSETLLRWQAARFPHGWQEIIEAETSAETIGPDENRSYELQLAEGLLTVTVHRSIADGTTPTSIAFAPAPDRDDLVQVFVTLENWSDGVSSHSRQPARMIWHDGRRIEEWTSILDGAFFLDASFRPPSEGRNTHSVARPELAQDARDLGDRIDVGEQIWWWMPEDRYLDYAERDRLRGRWWTVDGERRMVLTTSPDGDEQVDFESGRWLTWSRYAIDSWTPSEDVLTQALAQAGVVEDGPRWRVEVPQDGRRRLHMLRVRVRDAD